MMRELALILCLVLALPMNATPALLSNGSTTRDDTADIRDATTAITVLQFLKSNGLANHQNESGVGKGVSGDPFVTFLMKHSNNNSNPNYQFLAATGVGTLTFAGFGISAAGQWNCFVGEWESGEPIRAWIGGVYKGSSTAALSGSLFYDTQNVHMTWNETDNQTFDGVIGPTMLFTRRLTRSEKAALCNNPNTKLSGLYIWHPMRVADGTFMRDKSGEGNDGTLTAATFVNDGPPIRNKKRSM